ncbi:DUF1800 domain-containing protein [Acuticoccus mangrovi]|uniref:DUF1800 domain-containing protein n=1 Tax=Acuticoccus mangrovi TaxID=2796142 RepID=A0A934IPT2_9HYPH|nr:DUF1800 domain-containing protein [Acuticoccus mangrovi]MBJ3775815.1 DUF1800 domain-containing protein [Acuticoccus mangrovi]
MRPRELTAVTRFGLGPKPGDIAALAGDPVGYVREQCFRPNSALITGPDLPDSDTIRNDFVRLQGTFREARLSLKKRGSDEDARDDFQSAAKERNLAGRNIQAAEIGARYAHGLATDDPFVERLVLFWANHFAVHRLKSPVMRFVTGAFEREAIRPYVLANFSDMLAATTTHPAMLHYLDNDGSVAADSALGRRRKSRVNENLARELLELHTLGVDGGYTQADVIAVAHVLAGWNSGMSAKKRSAFQKTWHAFGPRTILGKTYRESGKRQIKAVLADLAQAPATARHISRKLARHFVGDNPPPALVDALTKSYLASGGDLREVTLTLVESDAAWSGDAVKAVPPYDFIVAAGRAMRLNKLPPHFVMVSARDLAQEIWGPPSPAGWPDDDGAFLGGDALLERVDFTRAVSQRFGRDVDPRQLARQLFGDALDPFVAEAVARAEDRNQAMVLLLMSPAFQRR